MLQYPLTLTFKLLAISPQITVTDNQNNLVCYVKQKLFKLKEIINIFADTNQQQLLYTVKADRIIDFSARYNFADAMGDSLGSVKRKGLRSIWRAQYDIFSVMNPDQPAFLIQEANPWVKMFDALFAEVPVLGIFTGFVFNPVYLVRDVNNNNNVVMRLEKVPAFLSRKFVIKQVDMMNESMEETVLLSLLMMLLLERVRG